jgi:hypothetical protein
MESKSFPKKIYRINLLSKRNLSIGLAFVLVALIAGIYFLFKPFPAGPSLAVKANVPEVASAIGRSTYANAPIAVKVVPFKGWSAYPIAPVAVKKVSVIGWSAYANAPVEDNATGIKLPSLAASAGQKVSPGQGMSKGFMLGGKLFPANP